MSHWAWGQEANPGGMDRGRGKVMRGTGRSGGRGTCSWDVLYEIRIKQCLLFYARMSHLVEIQERFDFFQTR